MKLDLILDESNNNRTCAAAEVVSSSFSKVMNLYIYFSFFIIGSNLLLETKLTADKSMT